MKKAFSLLELIFAIVVIGVLATFAVPKYLSTKDAAIISTLKRDIATVTSAIQTHIMTNNGTIEKISDAVTLNSSNWQIEDKKITDKNACLTIQIKEDDGNKLIELVVDETKMGICKKLREEGITSKSYELF